MGRRINRREWVKATALASGAWAVTGGAARAGDAPAKGAVVFRRDVPVRHEVDVFVAGGGPAGTAAAVAARGEGASVFLAEAHTCLGGMGTAARVPVFMQMTDGVNFLAAGYGRRVLERLKKEQSMRGPAHDIEALKRVYDALVTEAGAGFSFQTNLIGVDVESGRVAHVVCSAPGGLFAVRAKAYVDATGNGDLAAWAGAPFEKGDEQGHFMPGTLCSLWGDIDWGAWEAARPKGPQPDGHMLEKAFADGVFTVRDEHLTGMYRLGETFGTGNIGHTFDVDGTDEVSLTRALVWGRKSLKEYERYYREYLKGFEKARLLASGSLLGIRETRRIMGDYVLSVEDYKRRATFPDEIGRYAYSIDIHPMRPGKDSYEQHRKEFDEMYRYAKGESYGIPYRILTPRGLDNVLVAGRCVSADVRVHGSIRVMPGCFITGQAAGIAAAMSASQGVSTHRVDVKDLQGRLKRFGAYLPNA
ncbi:MAG TPA: FAD-dependent oxidoreductase [Verrucomicrobiae bacterium]|nr:FAD-dependent oxidoreductase [Verrucomicrobiae bacterium]